MYINRYCYFIFLFFACNFLQAQTPGFKHFSNKDGLVQSPISSIVQDKTGFIWLATQKGLIRYDGYEFNAYHPIANDSCTLSNNKVNTIFQDSKDQLWIGTANGLNLYNAAMGIFRRIDVWDIKGGRNYISSITEDHQKNIWVGTFGGLKKLNKKTYKLEDIPAYHQNLNFINSPVFSLFVDHENNVWAGTEAGLVKFNPINQRTMPLPNAFSLYEKFLDNRVLVIKQDLNQDLYFGTEISGVFRFSKNNSTLKNYFYQERKNTIASNWVKDILFKNNQVWFATRNGLSVLDKETQEFKNYRHDPLDEKSLNDNSIWSLLMDRNNCIWVGTFAGGLNFYYNGNSNFHNIGEKVGKPIGLNHALVTSVVQDNDNTLWIGTAGGLNHFNLNVNTSASYNVHIKNNTQPFNGVKSLSDDGRGNLWVGTLNGVSLFNKKLRKLKFIDLHSSHSKLSENLISCILSDGEGAWIGTNGGGLRYVLPNGQSPVLLTKASEERTTVVSDNHKEQNKTKHFLTSNNENGLSDNYITALLKDGADILWIGTQNGLNRYHIKSNRILGVYQKIGNKKYHLSKSNVLALFKDSKNRFWIGTEDGGLNYFDSQNQKFYVIDKQHGLNDNVIHAIVEDAQNNLWVSTDLGLSEIKIKKFELPFKKENLSITAYTTNDGLISNQFSNQAGIRLKGGEMVFGGINGLTIFHPEKITKNTTPPPIVITELLVNNSSLKAGTNSMCLLGPAAEIQNLELDYDQSTLGIKFAALNYINPYNNSYAYKLEGPGLADNWLVIDNQRVVNFTNLRPGRYVFSVKAANNDGVWSHEIKSLNIYIRPPLWLTWWAYLIYLVLLAAAAYTIFIFIRNRERLKRDLYVEHAHNEKLNELYAMKLNFFTNISHEIRTPLTLILGPLEKLIHEHTNADFSKTLLLIKSNADRLMKLVTELLDFRKAEEGHLKIYCRCENIVPFCHQIYKSFESLALTRQIAFNFSAPPEPVFIYFDSNQLEKVIFNLLSNAFKFTDDGGEISLAIDQVAENDHWIEITVIDNGRGIPENFKDRLFESFSQADDNATQHIGTGIGLAMAKNIVELHKGTIKATSHQLEKNQTRFTVSLQKGNHHFSPSEILSQTITSQSTPSIALPLSTEDQLFATSGYFGNKKYTLMIVEDNVEVRELIIDSLKVGYHTIDCSDGQIALDLLEKEMPDLIVSDIMMPNIDGIELCQRVKSSEATNHIPFILLTAKASVEHQLEGLGMGADAYLSKPFSLQLLQLNIRNLLRAQEVVRAKFSKNILISPSDINAVTPEEKFIAKLMAIIERRMADASFDVLDLVDEIGMSRSVLYKKVQQLTNYAVADLIKEVRLKRAAQLLKETSFNINEITYMIGFNNRKHFSKEFKKRYRLNPSVFAKENKVTDKESYYQL
ncbi:response regulator [Pedobacter chinensis]|uniref:histidine kinase n=1 Tax=Pedobacter chinensis TaxID=2282421 RepID=A0A369PVD1_9SPHI|nr:two-component regulator propeller domain-containing protein [Pedobacter chinensis]RDC56533.1 response regulator [Pedobacter chinensis]